MSAVPLIRAAALDLPGVAHGFTTRRGGVSRGPLATLNLARRPGEDEASLRTNWERAVRALAPERSAADVALLSQVHGARVLRVEAPTGPLATAGEADAAVTTRPGLVLAVRGADCVPVLLAAPGAVGVAHAGWRGVVAGVVGAVVEALARAAGVEASAVRAAVGPRIGGAAYEVGPEVVEAIEAARLPRGLFLRERPSGRPGVDLGAAVAEQLRRAGVGAVDVLAGVCTATRDDLYSHRADGPATGRHAGLIALEA